MCVSGIRTAFEFLKLTKEVTLPENCRKVKAKVLLFQAGNDPLVEPSGQLRFARKASDVRIVRYEKSKHEIFNATEEIRRDYYARIFRFLEE